MTARVRAIVTRGLAVWMAAALLGAATLLLWPGPGLDERDGLVQFMDRHLARSTPNVLILGNSQAGHAIEPNRLGKLLRRRVLSLPVPGSQAPIWYAVLENRVYGAGHRPKLVILASTLYTLVGLGSGSRTHEEALNAQLSDHEPVIEAKVRPAQSNLQFLATRNRAALTRIATWAVPATVLGPWIPSPQTLHRDTARTRLRLTFERVFGEAEMLGRRQPAARPGVRQVVTPPPLPALEDSLLPDLIDLTRANGSRLLFVRLGPGLDPDEPRPDDALVRGVMRMLHEGGAGIVDLSAMPLAIGDYLDDVHLAMRGRLRVTRRLAERLRKAGRVVLPPPRVVLRPTRVDRTGAPPPVRFAEPLGTAHDSCTARIEVPVLRLLGERPGDRALPVGLSQAGTPLHHVGGSGTKCRAGELAAGATSLWFAPPSGFVASRPVRVEPIHLAVGPDGREVGWVWPGTSITFWFEPPEDPKPLFAEVFATAYGKYRTRPTAGPAGEPLVPLTRARGRRYRSRFEIPPASGPWAITVSSPADGPLLAVEGLSARNYSGNQVYVAVGEGP